MSKHTTVTPPFRPSNIYLQLIAWLTIQSIFRFVLRHSTTVLMAQLWNHTIVA